MPNRARRPIHYSKGTSGPSTHHGTGDFGLAHRLQSGSSRLSTLDRLTQNLSVYLLALFSVRHASALRPGCFAKSSILGRRPSGSQPFLLRLPPFFHCCVSFSCLMWGRDVVTAQHFAFPPMLLSSFHPRHGRARFQ